ncbi:hypothetical protein MGN70_011579 [Eutypa lata]|nr:hypothetical protein MGN70_011579 [Eutypa lata]
MSSRLLTMKFMQRAAASSTASSPSTPQSEEKSSKRRKLSHSPSTQQSIDALVDQTAVRKALADEERKRQEAVVRNAAESGDARWVLNTQKTGATRSRPVQTPLNVVQVGFAQIDSSDNADGQVGSLGTDHGAIQPFRRYNMDKKKARDNRQSDDDDSDSDSDSASGSDSSQVNGTRRKSYGSNASTPIDPERAGEVRKALLGKKTAEQARATKLAEVRRKKEVKLNRPNPNSGLSSISSGGGGPSGRNSFPITCHRCHKTGHKASDCKGSAR